MSNEVAKVEEGEGGPPAKKKMAGKTLILFIVLPAILLLGGGGAAAYFFIFAKKPAAEASAEGHGKEDAHGKKEEGGHGKKEEGGHGKKEEKKEAGGHGKKEEKGEHGGGGGGGDEKSAIKTEEGPNGEIYITLPDIVENITTADNRPIYLKLRLSLQVKNQEVADAIMPAMPRIKDQYTGFLRELRMEDLRGSEGYSRLQLELLKRANLAVAPAQIDAILIQEMLVS